MAYSKCCCNETPPTLDEILICFYPHFIEELSKVVFKKIVLCNTPAKLDAIMFAQHMLVINAQEMRKFHTAYACFKCTRFWQSFLVNNFADLLYSAGNKIKSSSCRWWHFVTATSVIGANLSHFRVVFFMFLFCICFYLFVCQSSRIRGFLFVLFCFVFCFASTMKF